MANDETIMFDGDHEIEEFLQKYIVEKVLVGVNENITQINDTVSNLNYDLKSIENACNTTNMNLAMLSKDNKSDTGESS